VPLWIKQGEFLRHRQPWLAYGNDYQHCKILSRYFNGLTHLESNGPGDT